MPKQTTNKKVVASKSGRKISTPVGLLFIAVGALLLTIAGTFAYTQYKERDLQAKAARWKEIKPFSIERNGGDGVKFVGCREYTDIGPDSQQNKNVRVTVLASKPKNLKYSGKNSNFSDGQPRLYLLKKTTNGASGVLPYKWWNNELAVAQLSDLKVGDKLVVYVQSDASLTGFYDRDNFDTKDPYAAKIGSQVKRIYYAYYTEFQSNNKDKKQQQIKEKTFNKNLISVAQLPNCN